MELATGALGSLLPKLGQLLQDEYNLQKGAKKNIEFLTRELQSIQAALRSVGELPPEQVGELVKIWAHDARVLSYNMEDEEYYRQSQDSARDRPRYQGHQGACQRGGRATW